MYASILLYHFASDRQVILFNEAHYKKQVSDNLSLLVRMPQ